MQQAMFLNLPQFLKAVRDAMSAVCLDMSAARKNVSVCPRAHVFHYGWLPGPSSHSPRVHVLKGPGPDQGAKAIGQGSNPLGVKKGFLQKGLKKGFLKVKKKGSSGKQGETRVNKGKKGKQKG